MYFEEKAIGVQCDNCGKVYEDTVTGFSLWTDKKEVYPEDDGWYSDDGKHYCPACHSYDDKGDLIVKPKPQNAGN